MHWERKMGDVYFVAPGIESHTVGIAARRHEDAHYARCRGDSYVAKFSGHHQWSVDTRTTGRKSRLFLPKALTRLPSHKCDQQTLAHTTQRVQRLNVCQCPFTVTKILHLLPLRVCLCIAKQVVGLYFVMISSQLYWRQCKAVADHMISKKLCFFVERWCQMTRGAQSLLSVVWLEVVCLCFCPSRGPSPGFIPNSHCICSSVCHRIMITEWRTKVVVPWSVMFHGQPCVLTLHKMAA